MWRTGVSPGAAQAFSDEELEQFIDNHSWNHQTIKKFFRKKIKEVQKKTIEDLIKYMETAIGKHPYVESAKEFLKQLFGSYHICLSDEEIKKKESLNQKNK